MAVWPPSAGAPCRLVAWRAGRRCQEVAGRRHTLPWTKGCTRSSVSEPAVIRRDCAEREAVQRGDTTQSPQMYSGSEGRKAPEGVRRNGGDDGSKHRLMLLVRCFCPAFATLPPAPAPSRRRAFPAPSTALPVINSGPRCIAWRSSTICPRVMTALAREQSACLSPPRASSWLTRCVGVQGGSGPGENYKRGSACSCRTSSTLMFFMAASATRQSGCVATIERVMALAVHGRCACPLPLPLTVPPQRCP